MELTALIIFALAFAWACAKDDAEDIAANLRINHPAQWTFRAAIVLAASAILGLPWLSIGLAFLFSAVFRYTLNRLRDDWWWYLGPRLDARGSSDSKYDQFFHWLVWTAQGKQYDNEGYYRYHDHAPGYIACVVEVCIFGSVLYLHL